MIGSCDAARRDDGGVPEWDRAIEACDPASLLVAITRRLGAQDVTAAAEDVLQESLCRAWASREHVEWRGHRAFRAWILTTIDHCIADMGRRAFVRRERPMGLGDESHMVGGATGRVGSTTPSRLAVYREQAAIIQDALGTLDPEVREVVVQRLVFQRELEAIAEGMGIGVGAVRHRFRKGCELYKRALRRSLGGLSTIGSGACSTSVVGAVRP